MARYAYGMVDDRRAAAKLNRAYNKLVKQSWTSTRDLVSFGANFARQIVPYDTGQTWKAIKTSTNPKKTGSEGNIYIANIRREDSGAFSNSLSKTTQELVSIMHRWSGSKHHFNSGDPRFMYTTRDVMNSLGKKQVIASYKALKFK
jgi:hypothetical protein